MDLADRANDANMRLNIETSEGAFVNVFPDEIVEYNDDKFDMDGNPETTNDSLKINSFSKDDQDFYFVQDNSVVTLLNKSIEKDDDNNSVDVFSKANLSITGLGSSFLELAGDINWVSNSLSIIGIEGDKAGLSTVTVQAFDSDTPRLASELKTFEINYEIGTPNKPEMGKEILEGVGQEELSNGFDISVGIDGKGASVNDILKLFVSLMVVLQKSL